MEPELQYLELDDLLAIQYHLENYKKLMEDLGLLSARDERAVDDSLDAVSKEIDIQASAEVSATQPHLN